MAGAVLFEGQSVRVCDLNKVASADRKVPFKLGDTVVVLRLTASGNVILRGFSGAWRPHRFEPL